MSDRPSARRHRSARARVRVRRPHIFKFRVSDEEQAVIRERARGYSSPADFARRTLAAGRSLPVYRLRRVTDGFAAIQTVIDIASEGGYPDEAMAATEALREILNALRER